jgi:HD-like signal output (HDOD) protein
VPITTSLDQALQDVRPLPAVAQRAIELLRDPEFAVGTLVRLVGTDPALVARTLRLCNTARYGAGREITTLPAALTLLGTRTLMQLVLVGCSQGLFRGVPKSAYADADQLWHHSIACAMTCNDLAQRVADADPATAFTAGILHNVGKIAIASIASDSAIRVAEQATEGTETLDVTDLEFVAFGIDHAAASAVLARAWRLPDVLRFALERHHDPKALSGDDPLPAILHVADQLTLRRGINCAWPRARLALAESALSRLGIDEDEAEHVAAGVAKQLANARELLNPSGDQGR